MCLLLFKQLYRQYFHINIHVLSIICYIKEYVLTYGRGTQIFEWLERNNFHGKFIILDDDISDIIIYKDLAARIVQTSYYKGWGGFGFRHFVKAISLFIKGAIL